MLLSHKSNATITSAVSVHPKATLEAKPLLILQSSCFNLHHSSFKLFSLFDKYSCVTKLNQYFSVSAQLTI